VLTLREEVAGAFSKSCTVNSATKCVSHVSLRHPKFIINFCNEIVHKRKMFTIKFEVDGDLKV
jgi:hypothetical protein